MERILFILLKYLDLSEVIRRTSDGALSYEGNSIGRWFRDPKLLTL